jgi:hypothetical protein
MMSKAMRSRVLRPKVLPPKRKRRLIMGKINTTSTG